MSEEASSPSSSSPSSQHSHPGGRLPLPREHSYLPGALHPLHVERSSSTSGIHPSSLRRASSLSSSEHSLYDILPPQKIGNRKELAVLELEGVVVFPGTTLPIRLFDQAWIDFLGQQIDASRRTPGKSQAVRFGILTHEDEQARRQRARREEGGGGEEADAENARRQMDARTRRQSWARRTMGPNRLRRFSDLLLLDSRTDIVMQDAENRAGRDDNNGDGDGDESSSVDTAELPDLIPRASLPHSSSEDDSDDSSDVLPPADDSSDFAPPRALPREAMETDDDGYNSGEEPETNDQSDSDHSSMPGLVRRRSYHSSDDSSTASSMPGLVRRPSGMATSSDSDEESSLPMLRQRESQDHPIREELNSDDEERRPRLIRRLAPMMLDPEDRPPARILQRPIFPFDSDTLGWALARWIPELDGGRSEYQPAEYIGRIGTIVTVIYTHGDALVDNPTEESQMQATRRDSQVWRTHEGQLVVTALGTSRFRIVAFRDEDEANRRPSFGGRYSQAVQWFIVEELEDEPQPPPSFSSQHLSAFGNGAEAFFSTYQRRLMRRLSEVTPVPAFVYQSFWPWSLVARIRESVERTPSLAGILQSLPSLDGPFDSDAALRLVNPTRFSYWMASNLALTQKEKLELLELNTTVERLRYILGKVTKTEEAEENSIICKCCGIRLAKFADMFTVGGAEGTTGNYVNEHGIVHETITIRKLDEEEVSYSGGPQTRESWFPGYSWTIMSCACCRRHLGWKFRHVGDGRITLNRPKYFYGLSAANVSTLTQSLT